MTGKIKRLIEMIKNWLCKVDDDKDVEKIITIGLLKGHFMDD